MGFYLGGEGGSPLYGGEYLAENKSELIHAAFALNEGGYGQLDASGKPIFLGFQVGEKLGQNYTLEVTNPGGHSSRPVPKNAIYQLAAALTKVGQYQFPFESNDITIGYFGKLAPQKGGEIGAAMAAFAKNPKDMQAAARIARDPDYNGILHTTCVATLLSAGHANN